MIKKLKRDKKLMKMLLKYDLEEYKNILFEEKNEAK